MKIAVIGSGNVAYHLSKVLKNNNLGLVQIFGRNEKDLTSISEELKVPFSTSHLADADLYIISVSDNSIEEVSKQITNPNAVVAHTSGSMPVDVLKGNYKKASFYPLQTFSKAKAVDFSQIPVFIEADMPDVQRTLMDLAEKISSKVEVSTYEKRKYIHLTAVFACNFVNHLIARAKEISDAQNLPFEYFLPLIEETFDKLKYLDPKDAQTGPAMRNDQRVLDLHQDILSNEEQRSIFNTLNDSIKKMYNI